MHPSQVGARLVAFLARRAGVDHRSSTTALGVPWVSSTRLSSTTSTSSRTRTCPSNHKDHASLWVDFPNSNYDPKLGSELYNRYLDEMVLADKLGYDGIVLERAPQHPVHDEPRTEPDRGGAHPPDEGLGQRVRHSPELRVPEPAGRGVRDARRDVARAAPGRVPARHGHGVLGQRGEPRDRASPLPRVARHHPASAGPRTGRRATPATSTATGT